MNTIEAHEKRSVLKSGRMSLVLVLSLFLIQACLGPMPVRKAEIKPGEIWIEPDTGLEFVWVPGGCYMMGGRFQSGDLKNPDEIPVHEVCLDGFWLGRFEVTNAQYRRFRPRHDSGSSNGYALNGDSQPVVSVSWEEAKACARWLSHRNGGRYGFRLPTEAEWEYACRAGTMTRYYWGDEIDPRYVNFSDKHDPSGPSREDIDDGFAFTAPVGSFFPNAFGLYDMLGNVWEWCEDVYSKDAYKKHKHYNPVNKTSDDFWQGDIRVCRGGGWRALPGLVRCAGRGGAAPGSRSPSLGFRLLRIEAGFMSESFAP